MNLKVLMGSGHKVMLFTLPFLAAGLLLNILFPDLFGVGGPPIILKAVSVAIMLIGVIIWLWSVFLILTKVPRKELITGGPYSLVKHPLYTGIALLMLPWLGFLLNTWLGAFVGIALYIGTRIFAPKEEEILSKIFGSAWADYAGKVKIPWL